MAAGRPQRDVLDRDVRRTEATLANMKQQLAEGTQRVRQESDRNLKSVLAASLLNLKKVCSDFELFSIEANES